MIVSARVRHYHLSDSVPGTHEMISVAITAYNRPHHLRAALLALTRQTLKFDELIIADDGSDEDTKSVVEQFAGMFALPTIHVRQEHSDFRAARSRNNAIRNSRGDFIAFLDQDGLAHSNWLMYHVGLSRPNHFNIGGLIMLREDEVSDITEKEVLSGEFESVFPERERKRLEKLQSRSSTYAFLRRVGFGIKNKPKLDSGNFSAYRRDLEKVNGFDENYVGWGQEDDDLARRFYLAGIRPNPVIAPARVTHLWHTRGDTTPGEWKAGRNTGYYTRRQVKACCENGLKQPAEAVSDVVVTRYNFD